MPPFKEIFEIGRCRAGTAARTLTLENVGYFKIGDLEAIEAAGISLAEVADKFYAIYMEQIFVNNFVHADPHPGNVFVKPLPLPEETHIVEFHPGDPVPPAENRPYQIVFVDFGMGPSSPNGCARPCAITR